MKTFALLFDRLDATTKTTKKVDAIANYLAQCHPEDQLFAVAILIGNKPKRPIRTTLLREWVSQYSGVPLNLIEECYYAVGDLGETLSLILNRKPSTLTMNLNLKAVFQTVTDLRSTAEARQKELLFTYWKALSGTSLYLFNKMLTGSLRIGVSKKLVIRAIAQYLQQEPTSIEHQMMGIWNPLERSFSDLFPENPQPLAHHIPYPFFLAHPLVDKPEQLGALDEWFLEKKLDGIRGQIIVRNQQLYIWSRGEDLLTDKFPEFAELPELLPHGTVLDGEIIPWKDGAPLLFSLMQTRIGRKNLTKKALQTAPLVMMCFDVLEFEGVDLRNQPLWLRREVLKKITSNAQLSNLLLLSETLEFSTWQDADHFRIGARSQQCEGLMLKHRDSTYEVGRKKGGWWKWKTDPLTIDGVMLYAQAGHGRRANLFTDYTFAVWDDQLLVPFAKAYSGLTDAEIKQLDRWIKQNTLDKFGPVRSVKPEQVFEIAFEGIQRSSRHKSGIALRFPRILKWRTDKTAQQANTKSDLLELLKQFEI